MRSYCCELASPIPGRLNFALTPGVAVVNGKPCCQNGGSFSAGMPANGRGSKTRPADSGPKPRPVGFAPMPSNVSEVIEPGPL